MPLKSKDRGKVTRLGDIKFKEDSWVGQNLAKAKERIKFGEASLEAEGFYKNKKGDIFADISKIIFDENLLKRKAALQRHGNDFNKRLDEYCFPYDKKDRYFISTHNFANDLKVTMENVRRSWIYIYGDPGRGKTSLAIRAIWEMIKHYPEREATFLSVGKWTKSLFSGNKEYIDINKMKRIVLIDDFDKFDNKKDFQIRQLLLLIEELKNRHLVIITSNRSMEEILKSNSSSLDLEVMIDRIRGKSIALPRFTGQSYR